MPAVLVCEAPFLGVFLMGSRLAEVVIKDAEVVNRQVGEMTFHSQWGLLVTSDEETLAIEIQLGRGRSAYPAGRYHIGGRSFDRDKYKRPCFASTGLELIPIPGSVGQK